MKDTSVEKKNVDVSDTLKEIFENVNQWLVFAETKNGVLISLNGLLLFRVVDSFKDLNINESNLKLSVFYIIFTYTNIYICNFITTKIIFSKRNCV